MTPEEAADWLDRISGLGWRLTLDRVEEALERLGRPQDSFSAVHVAGTNGKGSCCAFVEAALLAAGLPTGRFTSPHVCRVEERVRVGGRDLDPHDLALCLTRVREAAADDLPITYFEAMTAAGYLAFADGGVTLAAVEVGLGGRLDATRTCVPAVSVITSVGLDHTNVLGDTPALIAGEKAGILRPGVPAVTGATGEALAAIERRAAEVGAPLRVLGRDVRLSRGADGGWTYEGPSWTLRGWSTSLEGGHQAHNAACALAAVELLAGSGVPVTPAHARLGLARAAIRGRFERVPSPAEGPELIVDCAHNADGAAALAALVREALPGRRLHLVFGALADKALQAEVDTLAPLAARVTAVTVEAGRRTRSAAEVADALGRASAAPVDAIDDPVEAVRAALAAAAPADVVLVAGSVYLAGAVLAASDAGALWPAPAPRASLAACSAGASPR